MTGRLVPPIEPIDHVCGTPGAALELVMFGDFQCPYCRTAQPQVHRVRRELGDRLLFAFRHFPLIEMHPMAEPAAEASESAAAQGNFWAYHDALYVSQPALSPQLLLTLAERLGLDPELVAHDLETGRWRPRVVRDLESGLASGVAGTPTFFVNGRLHQGEHHAESLIAALGATAGVGQPPRQSVPRSSQVGAPPPHPG
jgi:protein-disulfide isomerase